MEFGCSVRVGSAGAEGPKSIHHKHLGAKVCALRTEIDHHLGRHIEYNGVMKKDDSMSDGQIIETLDLIFAAGFEFGKANLMNTKESLALFKMTMKNSTLRDQCFKALDEGIARTNRLDAADRKKNADMN